MLLLVGEDGSVFDLDRYKSNQIRYEQQMYQLKLSHYSDNLDLVFDENVWSALSIRVQ